MARSRLFLAAPLLAAAAACSTGSIDTGWSRAPDLSVYSAMNHFGALAREQEVLCVGRSPARVDRDWQRHFGARHEAVRAAMTTLYGTAAIERARLAAGSRVPCEPLSYDRWWESYTQLLRLLEVRLSQRSAG